MFGIWSIQNNKLLNSHFLKYNIKGMKYMQLMHRSVLPTEMGSVHICTYTEKPGNLLISLRVEMLSIVSYFYGMLISFVVNPAVTKFSPTQQLCLHVLAKIQTSYFFVLALFHYLHTVDSARVLF